MSGSSKYNKLSQDEEDPNIYPTATAVPLQAVRASPDGLHPAVIEGGVIGGNNCCRFFHSMILLRLRS
jgi:hypothetical protein